MKIDARKWRTLLVSASLSVAISAAQAQDYAWRHAGAPPRVGNALAPVVPPVTPHTDSVGTHGLRLRLEYLETLTGNVELRRHEYFIDGNLKGQRPRTSIAWSVRWYF